MYSEAMRAVADDPAVDAVLLNVFVGTKLILLNLEDVAELSRMSDKPVVVWYLGERSQDYEFQKTAGELGILAFPELYRAVECMAAVMKLGKRLDEAPPAESTRSMPALRTDLKQILANSSKPLDEFNSKRILNFYGLPCVAEEKVNDVVSCREAAERLGYPLVMKGLQPGGVHKTELGLVQPNIGNKSSAVQTYRALMKKMEGNGSVLVQRQIKGELELILGMVRDKQFGPCIMFGLGGIMAEVFGDVAFAMAPLNTREALDLIGRIQDRLLEGFRGMPPVDREELARIW